MQWVDSDDGVCTCWWCKERMVWYAVSGLRWGCASMLLAWRRNGTRHEWILDDGVCPRGLPGVALLANAPEKLPDKKKARKDEVRFLSCLGLFVLCPSVFLMQQYEVDGNININLRMFFSFFFDGGGRVGGGIVLHFTSYLTKFGTRTTASVLKQDPDAYKVKRNANLTWPKKKRVQIYGQCPFLFFYDKTVMVDWGLEINYNSVPMHMLFTFFPMPAWLFIFAINFFLG